MVVMEVVMEVVLEVVLAGVERVVMGATKFRALYVGGMMGILLLRLCCPPKVKGKFY